MIKVLRAFREQGMLWGLENAFCQFKRWIDHEKDALILVELEGQRRWMEIARSAEAIHGRGSMLDPDHPEVLIYLAEGIIPRHRYDAARRLKQNADARLPDPGA